MAVAAITAEPAPHAAARGFAFLPSVQLRHLSDDTIAAAQHKLINESDSEGQRRMQRLHGGSRDKLEVSPNLLAGVGLVRGGAGTALVGDPKTVAARIAEYQALGIDTIIASGYPHLEGSYRGRRTAVPAAEHHPIAQRVPVPAGGPALLTGGGSLMTTNAVARSPA